MAFLDNESVGNRMKIKREETELKPRKYAMKAGVDPSQYAKIEKGDLPITENVLEKLVTTYGLDKDYILHGTNVPETGTGTPAKGHFKARGEAYWSNRCLQLFDELDNLKRKGRGKEINFGELGRDIEKIAGIQKAMMEILLLIASETGSKKAVYNKSVEILRKHRLESSSVGKGS